MRRDPTGHPFEEVAEQTPDQLAHCDFYFWWPMNSEEQNEKWLKLLLGVHEKTRTNATIYVAHDTHYHTDMRTLPRLARQYEGVISRVFFDEGAALDGEASYTTPFFDRPGRWGVFHLARFLAGPAAAAVPRGNAPGAPHARPRRVRPASVHAVPEATRPGFCAATTSEDGLGDCEGGESGTLALDDGRFGFGDIHTVEDCAEWCVHFCARCRFVSFSRAANDCSWYHSCNLDGLDTQTEAIYKHVSRAVVAEAAPTGKGRGRARGRGHRSRSRAQTTA